MLYNIKPIKYITLIKYRYLFVLNLVELYFILWNGNVLFYQSIKIISSSNKQTQTHTNLPITQSLFKYNIIFTT